LAFDFSLVISAYVIFDIFLGGLFVFIFAVGFAEDSFTVDVVFCVKLVFLFFIFLK